MKKDRKNLKLIITETETLYIMWNKVVDILLVISNNHNICQLN